MKNCPVCNELLGDSALRCIKCKYEFSVGEYFCSHCNKPLQNAKSVCECGGWAVTLTKKSKEVPPPLGWTRAELKDRAKSRLYSIIMLSVIACLLLSISEQVQFNYNRSYDTNSNETIIDFDGNGKVEAYTMNKETGQFVLANDTIEIINKFKLQIGWLKITLFETPDFSLIKNIFIIGFLILIPWTTFLLNPYYVGLNRFFMTNIYGKVSLKSVLFGFRNGNYFGVVKTMFFVDLKTLLWSLLLLIPGIVKSYEYMMIPYILSENPHINTADAFIISENMMDGNKWRVFVLDLSFILWEFLSMLTLGIAGVVWVVPYRCATRAELYHTFRTSYIYYEHMGTDQLKGYEE